MRILALLSSSYGLEDNIVKEMERKGHEVVYIEDKVYPFDSYFVKAHYYRFIQTLVRYLKVKYWRKKIKSNRELSTKFDKLICVNGYSVCPYLFLYLKSINPSIETVLFTWDSNCLYTFYRNYKYFNRIYSFDFLDVEKYNIKYLPIFWIKDDNWGNNRLKYKISFVGSLHNDRFEVLNRIVNKLLPITNNYYIKLVVDASLPRFSFLRYVIYKLFNVKRNFITQYRLVKNIDSSTLVMFESVPIDVFNEILRDSEIILDIEQPFQSGLTSRMMMALGLGKKIITTNKYITKTPLYSPEYISIIDRIDPKIDAEFINEPIAENTTFSQKMESYELEKWTDVLLYGEVGK